MGTAALLFVAVCGCQKRAPESAVSAAADAGSPLIVDAAAADAGAEVAEQPSAPRFIVRDNKTRCIQAPCMSLDAMPVNSSASTEKISDVDLSALGLSDKEQQLLLSEVYGNRGLEVEGEIVERPSSVGRGGMARVLRVTRVYPPSAAE